MISKIGDLWAAAEEWLATIGAILAIPFAMFCIISLSATGGKW